MVDYALPIAANVFEIGRFAADARARAFAAIVEG